MKILVQSSLNDGYYCHIYNDDRMVIIFKDRQFWVTPDKRDWRQAIEYGLSANIPEEQLDFFPSKASEEDF